VESCLCQQNKKKVIPCRARQGPEAHPDYTLIYLFLFSIAKLKINGT
jgi:hypothetical protein